jgi:ubiquinol-cytochrome c reductase cytochrome c1 subunit
MKNRFFSAVLLALAVALSAGSAKAGGAAIELPVQAWSFDGVLGKFDKHQLQRGFQVYKEVCSSCHALSLVAYRDLAFLGYNEKEIKAIAAGATVKDGPNEEGEMFDRPGLPSDKFVPPFANENAARAANGGAYPPDLSLIAKARFGGADYIKALLTGYASPPAGVELPEGKYYNKYFDGHQIAMAPPVADGAVTYADGSPQTLDQYSSDIAAFLTWAAEPKLEARKQMGLRVMLFLTIMTIFLYLAKRQIWAMVKKK